MRKKREIENEIKKKRKKEVKTIKKISRNIMGEDVSCSGLYLLIKNVKIFKSLLLKKILKIIGILNTLIHL